MTARHAAPGRRWSPVAYLPGKHRYAGSGRERADLHLDQLAPADLPTVPLPLLSELLAASVLEASQRPVARLDFRRPRATAAPR